MNPPDGNNQVPVHDTSADLFDYARLQRQAGFVLRSVKRHPFLFSFVFVVMSGLVVALTLLWPKTYNVQTRILAQRNQMMASLGNPRRSVPGDADAPTRAASETVLRRDNLVALIKQTNLLDRWEATRPPLMRVKDTISNAIEGKPNDIDRLDSMELLLERRLHVAVQDGTVVIAIEWPEGQQAYQLVEAAQQNFLEARYVTEVSSIEEAISILQAHASNLESSVLRTMEDIQKLETTAPHAPHVASSSPSPPKSALGMAEAGPDQEKTQVKFLLRAKRRAIADLEESRQKRLSELQAKLAEEKVVYSDQHPVIRDTLQQIAALKEDSPQITALRADEAALLSEYRTRGGGGDPDEPEHPHSSENRTMTPTVSMPAGESPQLAYAKEQLRISNDTLQDIYLRIDAARIEEDTARAAFKYRYSVINPARLPKKADKPNVPLTIVGGMIGALALSVFATLLRDVRKGRFLEGWQIEEKLQLPLLAEVRSP